MLLETIGSVSRSVQVAARPRVRELVRTCTRWPRSGPSVTRRTARGRAVLLTRVSHAAGAETTSTRSPCSARTRRAAGRRARGWCRRSGTRWRLAVGGDMPPEGPGQVGDPRAGPGLDVHVDRREARLRTGRSDRIQLWSVGPPSVFGLNVLA